MRTLSNQTVPLIQSAAPDPAIDVPDLIEEVGSSAKPTCRASTEKDRS